MQDDLLRGRQLSQLAHIAFMIWHGWSKNWGGEELQELR